MKKALALVLTTVLLIFGTTFLPVQADNDEELPFSFIPPIVNQG